MAPSKLRILVPLEHPGAEDSLVLFAANLAQIRRGELHLTHIVTAEDTVPQAEELLQRAAGLAAGLGVSATSHLVEDQTVTRGIQETISRWQCNMMVMGWYREVEENAILSSRNRALTKAIDVDTLILKDRDFHLPRRILVPSGGGTHTLMGIQLAYELAQKWNAEMEILRIARDPQCRPDDPILQRYCAQLYDSMRLQLDLMGVDVPLTILPATEVVPSILAHTRKDDLVVLGASNDWLQEQHLAGSIPDEIASQVPGSVLMFRSSTSSQVRLSNIFWEHTIRLDLHPRDKWDAITRMVDALVEEKQIPLSERQNVLDAALMREHEASTAFGHETAIPHAPIPDLPGVIGCLGICPEGVDFEDATHSQVRYIFLLLTPQQNYRSYLPVLALISALMHRGSNRAAFLGCKTPAEVMTVIKQHENS